MSDRLNRIKGKEKGDGKETDTERGRGDRENKAGEKRENIEL